MGKEFPLIKTKPRYGHFPPFRPGRLPAPPSSWNARRGLVTAECQLPSPRAAPRSLLLRFLPSPLPTHVCTHTGSHMCSHSSHTHAQNTLTATHRPTHTDTRPHVDTPAHTDTCAHRMLTRSHTHIHTWTLLHTWTHMHTGCSHAHTHTPAGLSPSILLPLRHHFPCSFLYGFPCSSTRLQTPGSSPRCRNT